tara:strand:- start:5080 stop:5766 length:687 start_codon:yes stop_codon:yes gene_type:complete
MVEQFSKQLKEGTKKSHSAAENTKFVAGFLRGVLDPEQYRQLLTNFYYVYDTMEQRIRESTDNLVSMVSYPELERVNALEKDLRYYYGPMWRDKQIPSEACNTYCYRINEIAEKDPYLLIAHHYTRYIGDLSGGQILKGIASKALDNPVGEGLHFYDFPEIEDAKEWKDGYRLCLDNMDLNEQQKNAIIVEANYAFRLNMYIFDEIQGSATKGFWKVLLATMFPKRGK